MEAKLEMTNPLYGNNEYAPFISTNAYLFRQKCYNNYSLKITIFSL